MANFLPLRMLAGFLLMAPLVQAHADDWAGLYFDLTSLVWMLVGALVWSVVYYLLDRLPVRRGHTRAAFVSKPVPGNSRASDQALVVDKGAGAEEKNDDFSEYMTPLDEDTTVTVEEVSDVVAQVDLFLLLGRFDVAISMLLARIGSENDDDPRTWFKLLDIYHSQGDRANFDKLAENIRVRFNVTLPTWDESTLQAKKRYGLEHFPHLLGRISESWRSSSCLSYLKSLARDNRSGARTGFSEEAFREVMFLISILEQEDIIQ